MEVADLVREFADCVAAQSAAIAEGDSNRGNKFANRYITAFERLRSIGDRGRDALASLFEDSRPEVRVATATCLLRHCETRAKSVLEAEARGSGLVALGATYALKHWAEGTWELDPE